MKSIHIQDRFTTLAFQDHPPVSLQKRVTSPPQKKLYNKRWKQHHMIIICCYIEITPKKNMQTNLSSSNFINKTTSNKKPTNLNQPTSTADCWQETWKSWEARLARKRFPGAVRDTLAVTFGKRSTWKRHLEANRFKQITFEVSRTCFGGKYIFHEKYCLGSGAHDFLLRDVSCLI